MDQKVNMFEYTVKLFNICGVIPSDNVNSSLWKSILFRIFMIFSFAIFILMVSLQILGLYYYWGNIFLMTDCLILLTGFAASYTTTTYFIYYWKDASKLIEAFETKSIYSMELVRTNQRHMKIVNDSRNFALLLSKATFFLILLSGVMYILPTFVRHLSATDEDILQEAETVEGFTKYFVFVMWLPPVVKQPFVIRLTYVIQCICTFRGFMFAATFVPIEILLLIYNGTQFKIISSILNEMDEIIYNLENSDEIVDEISQQKNVSYGEVLPKSAESETALEVPKYEIDRRRGKETWTKPQLTCQLRSEILQNVLHVYNFNRKSGKFIDISSDDLTPTAGEDAASLYLSECIKLHQACIILSGEINTFMSPCILLGSLCITTFMITSVFQLSLAINIKYILFIFTFLTILYVYGWCGEVVVSESTTVGDTAYHCLWYERSTRFKRLLLMVMLRAKNPIHINCGPIWVCSFDLVVQLLHTMYTFFAVLRRVHET